MPDTLPPSVPTGSARAARTAGKKLEFARQYCSQCLVPIQLISRHARSLDATRKLRRIRTHKKRIRNSPNESRFQALCQSQQTTKLAARELRLSALLARSRASRRRSLHRTTSRRSARRRAPQSRAIGLSGIVRSVLAGDTRRVLRQIVGDREPRRLVDDKTRARAEWRACAFWRCWQLQCEDRIKGPSISKRTPPHRQLPRRAVIPPRPWRVRRTRYRP